MAYEKQTWVNGVTPLDAEHLNHMEQGISEADGDMLASVYDPQGKAQDVFAYVDNAIANAIGTALEASY